MQRTSCSMTMCKAIFLMILFALLASCSRLPDVNRLQGNMDQMVHYMGMMVYNTAKMAAVAERMQQKSDNLLSNLEKKGASAERAIQNYSQAFLDNDRAMIKTLQGIRQELGELRQSLRGAPTASDSQEQLRINAQFQSKLNELEKRLAAVSAKLANQDSGKLQ